MKTKQYLYPTPGGAYYLAQSNVDNWQKNVLKKLFSYSTSPELNNDFLILLFDTQDQLEISSKIDACKELKLIQVIDKPLKAPEGDIEQNLNKLIQSFSKKEKVLLSDSQGFCISNCGFPSEMIEEISVLSADIAIMHKRRALNINKNLGLNSQAWSIVDASGNSCLGFWPLNIEDEVFVLAIEGTPFFNQTAIITLIWILYLRYGKKPT